MNREVGVEHETRESGAGSALADSLGWLRASLGLLAGTAAVIYVTGGVVLALRLAFEGLPSLDVVSELPREFLFSIGATQVVAPAALVGATLGLIELGQSDNRLEFSHLRWSQVAHCRRLRNAYLLFWSSMPVVLLTPAIVRVVSDDKIAAGSWLLVLVWLVFAVALLALLVAWRISNRFTLRGEGAKYNSVNSACCCKRARLSFHDPHSLWMAINDPARSFWPHCTCERRLGEGDAPRLGRLEVVEMLWGVAMSILVAVWIDVGSNSHAVAVFLAIAAVVALLVAHAVVWARGAIGDRARGGEQNTRFLGIMSWAATAVLAVPSFVAFGALLPLTPAVVCTDRSNTQPFVAASGLYVGETANEVYLGEHLEHRMVVIPVAQVARLTFGNNADQTSLCRRSASGRF
jgi:hypothetical protein